MSCINVSSLPFCACGPYPSSGGRVTFCGVGSWLVRHGLPLLLQVLIHNGLMSQVEDHAYELCMRAEGITLPASGHFTISAATGGLAGRRN